KRIDRDLHLIAALPGVWLFVAGDPTEDPAEHSNLQRLAARLGVADRVIFGGRLAPREVRTGTAYSIRDLLAEATLASFLTSYDYESYGNPIGEAIASGVPYLTSDYELYHTVYGHLGLRAPTLTTDLPTPSFVDSVAELLLDEGKRARMAE